MDRPYGVSHSPYDPYDPRTDSDEEDCPEVAQSVFYPISHGAGEPRLKEGPVHHSEQPVQSIEDVVPSEQPQPPAGPYVARYLTEVLFINHSPDRLTVTTQTSGSVTEFHLTLTGVGKEVGVHEPLAPLEQEAPLDPQEIPGIETPFEDFPVLDKPLSKELEEVYSVPEVLPKEPTDASFCAEHNGKMVVNLNGVSRYYSIFYNGKSEPQASEICKNKLYANGNGEALDNNWMINGLNNTLYEHDSGFDHSGVWRIMADGRYHTTISYDYRAVISGKLVSPGITASLCLFMYRPSSGVIVTLAYATLFLARTKVGQKSGQVTISTDINVQRGDELFLGIAGMDGVKDEQIAVAKVAFTGVGWTGFDSLNTPGNQYYGLRWSGQRLC
jgi:hypothetical protein